MVISHRTLIVSAVSLAMLSALALAVGLAAPALELGDGERFVLYRTMGLRSDSLARLGGAGLLLAGGGILLFAAGWALPAHPDGTESVTWLKVKCRRLWDAVNRDWVAAAVLVPAGLYTVVLALYVLPEIPWVAPDSVGYIRLSPTRTLLYPVLLRGLATVSSDPVVLVAAPVIAGVLATIFLALVVQSVIRNILVSVPAGLLMLFNWSLLQWGVMILSDYSFYTFIILSYAFVLLAIRQPHARWLLMIAVCGGLAMAIRPIGIILFVAIPFILVLHWPRWRRVLAYLVFPALLLTFVQAGANWLVFDFFALTRFAGYPMAENTVFLLKPDTPTEHPELRDRLIALAAPHKEILARLPSLQERYLYFVEASNPLIGHAGRIAHEYGLERRIIERSDTAMHRRFSTALNALPGLNAAFKRYPPIINPDWAWVDETLERMAWRAHLYNLREFASLTTMKLRYSWQSVLQIKKLKEDFRQRRSLDLSDPEMGLNREISAPPRDDLPFVGVAGFNAPAAPVRWFGSVFSIPLTVLAAAVGAIILTVRQMRRRNGVDPKFASLAYLGGITILYHLAISVAQYPLGRFLSVVNAGPAVLLFAPLLAFAWMVEQGAETRRNRLAGDTNRLHG